MAYFKEIVTKAVIGKGKRVTSTNHVIKPNHTPDTVLGCWIINHNFNGSSVNKDVFVDGNYDVNVWYSYDNNSKTDVATGNFTYKDRMNVPVSNNTSLSDNADVIVNSLADPTVTDVKIDGDNINFAVRKEMGIEIVGDTKIRVNVEDDFDDYTEIYDDVLSDDILSEIDNEITEDYLNEEHSEEEEK